MAINTAEKRPVQISTASDDKPESHADLLEDFRLLWLDLRGLTHDHLQLATLEARRAGNSLISMVAAGMVMAVLLIGVWVGLMAAATLALIQSHLIGDIAAILSIVGANFVLALLLYWFIRRKSRYLLFPETLHSLQDKED